MDKKLWISFEEAEELVSGKPCFVTKLPTQTTVKEAVSHEPKEYVHRSKAPNFADPISYMPWVYQ